MCMYRGKIDCTFDASELNPFTCVTLKLMRSFVNRCFVHSNDTFATKVRTSIRPLPHPVHMHVSIRLLANIDASSWIKTGWTSQSNTEIVLSSNSFDEQFRAKKTIIAHLNFWYQYNSNEIYVRAVKRSLPLVLHFLMLLCRITHGGAFFVDPKFSSARVASRFFTTVLHAFLSSSWCPRALLRLVWSNDVSSSRMLRSSFWTFSCFSLYFMIQRLELFLLEWARRNIAMTISEFILVLFQTSGGMLATIYFCIRVRAGILYRKHFFCCISSGHVVIDSCNLCSFCFCVIDFSSLAMQSILGNFLCSSSLLCKERRVFLDAGTSRCLPWTTTRRSGQEEEEARRKHRVNPDRRGGWRWVPNTGSFRCPLKVGTRTGRGASCRTRPVTTTIWVSTTGYVPSRYYAFVYRECDARLSEYRLLSAYFPYFSYRSSTCQSFALEP